MCRARRRSRPLPSSLIGFIDPLAATSWSTSVADTRDAEHVPHMNIRVGDGDEDSMHVYLNQARSHLVLRDPRAGLI